jgi:hypothetical protein
MYNKNANEIYINILLACILIINGFLLPFFYYKILKFLIDSRRETSYNYNKKKEIKNTFQITKGLIFSFVFFGFSYVTYFFLILVKDYQKLIPPSIYLYLFLFARSNSLFNPILYAITNPLFKRGFKKVIYSVIGLKSENNSNFDEKNLVYN